MQYRRWHIKFESMHQRQDSTSLKVIEYKFASDEHI